MSAANHEIRLGKRKPLSSEAPIQLNVLTFALPLNKKVSKVGVGIYQRENSRQLLLKASSGVRDWDGRRVIVPLPQQP